MRKFTLMRVNWVQLLRSFFINYNLLGQVALLWVRELNYESETAFEDTSFFAIQIEIPSMRDVLITAKSALALGK